jgi:hypothetical protein
MFTSDVENYPGFAKAVSGHELMAAFRAQAEHQGAELLTADVQKVDLSSRPFKVWVGEDENVLHLAKTIVIATGARANYLGLPNEELLKNKGVSACAVCDGALFRGQDVAVVGGGDTAMEEASYLAGVCGNVTLIHRRDEFRASRVMVERVQKNPKIRMLLSHVVDDVLDVKEDRVTAIRVRNLKSGDTATLSEDQRPGRVRRRRRGGLDLPASGDRGRHGLHGCARRRAFSPGRALRWRRTSPIRSPSSASFPLLSVSTPSGSPRLGRRASSRARFSRLRCSTKRRRRLVRLRELPGHPPVSRRRRLRARASLRSRRRRRPSPESDPRRHRARRGSTPASASDAWRSLPKRCADARAVRSTPRARKRCLREGRGSPACASWVRAPAPTKTRKAFRSSEKRANSSTR